MINLVKLVWYAKRAVRRNIVAVALHNCKRWETEREMGKKRSGGGCWHLNSTNRRIWVREGGRRIRAVCIYFHDQITMPFLSLRQMLE